MRLRLPKINQKAFLRLRSGPWAGLYPTYVEGLDATSISVAQPMFGADLVPLPIDEEVVVEWVDAGERFAFPCQVIGRTMQVVPIVMLTLPQPGMVKRHQQRDFVRLDATLPVVYARLPELESTGSTTADEEPQALQYLGSRTLDISGNGAQIVTHQVLPIGSKLVLKLDLQGEELEIGAEVVRLADQQGSNEAWLGVRFTELSERDRERIVRFIFNEQRTRRQKGLL